MRAVACAERTLTFHRFNIWEWRIERKERKREKEREQHMFLFPFLDQGLEKKRENGISSVPTARVASRVREAFPHGEKGSFGNKREIRVVSSVICGVACRD